MRWRRDLRVAYRALGAADTYAEWSVAAERVDVLTGADAWRARDESPCFDGASLRADIARIRSLTAPGDAEALATALTESLYRHLADFSAPELYGVALTGPQRVVEEYLATAEAAVLGLARARLPEVPARDRLDRFERAYQVFGRSALLLSGGATWGFHHLGVVKALLELELLPAILSGASTGAMIAAGVCARSDDELRSMFADLDGLRLDGLLPVGALEAVRQGALLDPARLYAVLRHNVGDSTFAEAFAHSGRVLNIAVSPTRTRQKPRVLCHLTSPEVLVASAALASSALPGLFPPVVLEARREGRIVPYVASERWIDGSLHGDLPKLRLARLHNVNHCVVSQANPHVVPFVRYHGERGLAPALAGLASSAARTRVAHASDLARRASRGGGLARLAEQTYALVSQDYRGDIDVFPPFDPALVAKVVQNPTRDDLRAFVRGGERAVWPKVAMIRNQTRIGRALGKAVALARAAAVTPEGVAP